MSNLGDLLASVVQEQNVRAAFGMRFDFASGTQYVWKGNGPLVDQEGHTWRGVGNVGVISGIELGIGAAPPALTVELSGLDPSFMALAANQAAEIKGRDCALYFLGFNVNWSLADRPAILRTAIMDRLVRKFDSKNRLVTITLTAESFLVTRFRSPNSYLTYADQNARYPLAGDRGLERISGYTGPARIVVWY